jgi:hypothetical protein
LLTTEQASLIPELNGVLRAMRLELANGTLDSMDDAVGRDVDLYLTVALSLLDPKPDRSARSAHYSENDAKVAKLLSLARKAEGAPKIKLFGKRRLLDFSQFKPRGHYTRTTKLQDYFRAMIWLGRVDFRMVDVRPSGERVFDRRQFDGAMGLAHLLEESGNTDRWRTIDETVELFVGPSDDFGPAETGALTKALGVRGPKGTTAVSDEKIERTLETHDFGAQRIGGNVRVVLEGVGEVSLASSFRLFGQAYVPDSEVFHQTSPEQVVERWVPDPLDVGYAVFANDQAATLLENDLKEYGPLAFRLERMRLMMDDQPKAYWESNLYTAWLGALRALSPTEERLKTKSRLPAVSKSEAWGRRLLNAQLGSWAELRHDTILYAKQSYGAMITCEFPDVYVEPYPEFWDRIGVMAKQFDRIDTSRFNERAKKRFEKFVGTLKQVSLHFGALSRRQLAGKPPTKRQLAFVNRMVRINRAQGCGTTEVQTPGWYYDLHFIESRADDFDPVIADVHTDGHNGQVLHVGTAAPNFALVTVDGCKGAAAYVGLVTSYHEVVTKNLKRLDDDQWKQMQWGEDAPSPVTWMSDLVVGER